MSILGQFQFRRDISANWALANPVLLDGEMGIESNTNQFKIGNGVLTWNSLPYGGIVGAIGPQGIQGPAGTISATTRTSPTASASTVLTTLISYNLGAGEVVAGSEYEFSASLRVINTNTATNGVVTLSVGAANVLVMTQALGATAAASPGSPVLIRGVINFASTTQAECVIHFFKSQAVAANILLNTSAPITVAASGATTIDLKFNTSGATSTFICRQASISKVK
jgi:hypothetical protein